MRRMDQMECFFARARKHTVRAVGRIHSARSNEAVRHVPVPAGVLVVAAVVMGGLIGTGQALSGPGGSGAGFERTVLWSPGASLDRLVVSEAWRMAMRERAIERNLERYAAYPVDRELAEKIMDAAESYDIDPDIAFGLIRAESSFRNQATSVVGAVGLTQLMPRTAAWMVPGTSVRDLRNPETNLDIGFMYLRYLLDKYDGNEDLALLAYNRGPGTVNRALRGGMNPDNGYAAFVRGEANHGHTLFTRTRR